MIFHGQVYKVYVNGKLHASLRYSTFLVLHQQLAKVIGGRRPDFPPKRLLPLSPNQLQERRVGLEKYMQTGERTN
jgi:sorting nexin-17